MRRNFKDNSFWARGYYVNTVGLGEANIKNQQLNESVKDDYDSGTDKDSFKGASKMKKILTKRL